MRCEMLLWNWNPFRELKNPIVATFTKGERVSYKKSHLNWFEESIGDIDKNINYILQLNVLCWMV